MPSVLVVNPKTLLKYVLSQLDFLSLSNGRSVLSPISIIWSVMPGCLTRHK